MTDINERVAVLENEVKNMKQSFTDFYKEDLAAKASISVEIKRFNDLVSKGKSSVAMLAAIGAGLIWLWSQVRPYVMGH